MHLCTISLVQTPPATKSPDRGFGDFIPILNVARLSVVISLRSESLISVPFRYIPSLIAPSSFAHVLLFKDIIGNLRNS